MYDMCMLCHVLLITTCFDNFCDHHQGSFTTVIRQQQTVKLCKWNHGTLQEMSQATDCQFIHC